MRICSGCAAHQPAWRFPFIRNGAARAAHAYAAAFAWKERRAVRLQAVMRVTAS